jgi:uncharacterized SAM-binding protein YcdF (DUF218 family)
MQFSDWYQKRWVRGLLGAMLFFLALFLFRHSILRGLGRALTVTEDTAVSDAIVVLGGNSQERGLHGAKLWHLGRAPMVICTGGNVPSVLAALDTVLLEAEITRNVMSNAGVPDSVLVVLTGATSTREEAEEIAMFVKEKGLQSLTIVSSQFHMARVRRTFRKVMPDFVLRYSGSPSLTYNEEEWWKSEEGLIMVNNEWMKTIYYLVKN